VVTRALQTRAELEHKLMLARAAVILAEDRGDMLDAEQARAVCDEALDTLMHLPQPRDAA